MSVVLIILFVIWFIEAPLNVTVSIANLRDAQDTLRLAVVDPNTTLAELIVARRHIGREKLRLAVAVLLLLIGFISFAQIVGVLPKSGGAITAITFILAHGLIIANSVADRKLRQDVRRAHRDH